MKKAILITLALLISASLYAQYRGTTWGENFDTFYQTKKFNWISGAPEWTNNEITTLKEPAQIMGEKNFVYYSWVAGSLTFITYEINWSQEIENQLLKNFENANYKINIEKKVNSLNSVPNGIPVQFGVEDLYNYLKGNQSILETFLAQENITGNAKLIKARYGTITDVLVYSNIYPGQIIVIYVGPIQDDF